MIDCRLPIADFRLPPFYSRWAQTAASKVLVCDAFNCNWQSAIGNRKYGSLNPRIAGRADAQLLALFQSNFFAAAGEHAGGSDARADCRAYRRAGAPTRDGSDDCADAGGGANFLDVTLRRAATAHTAFRVDLADALAATSGKNFDDLCAHLC